MATKIVLQGNPREALKKLVGEYKDQEEDTQNLLIETAVTSVMEEHPVVFSDSYEKASLRQQAEIIAKEELRLGAENRKLEEKILEEEKKDKESYGKRWKFYIWFGLFSMMVLAGYFLFVLYRIGDMSFVKNP